jgi:hypothetical protein
MSALIHKSRRRDSAPRYEKPKLTAAQKLQEQQETQAYEEKQQKIRQQQEERKIKLSSD